MVPPHAAPRHGIPWPNRSVAITPGSSRRSRRSPSLTRPPKPIPSVSSIRPRACGISMTKQACRRHSSTSATPVTTPSSATGTATAWRLRACIAKPTGTSTSGTRIHRDPVTSGSSSGTPGTYRSPATSTATDARPSRSTVQRTKPSTSSTSWARTTANSAQPSSHTCSATPVTSPS